MLEGCIEVSFSLISNGILGELFHRGKKLSCGDKYNTIICDHYVLNKMLNIYSIGYVVKCDTNSFFSFFSTKKKHSRFLKTLNVFCFLKLKKHQHKQHRPKNIASQDINRKVFEQINA